MFEIIIAAIAIVAVIAGFHFSAKADTFRAELAEQHADVTAKIAALRDEQHSCYRDRFGQDLDEFDVDLDGFVFTVVCVDRTESGANYVAQVEGECVELSFDVHTAKWCCSHWGEWVYSDTAAGALDDGYFTLPA